MAINFAQQNPLAAIEQQQAKAPAPLQVPAPQQQQAQAPGIGEQIGGAATQAGGQFAGKAIGAALTPALGPLGPIAGQVLGPAIGDLFGSLFNVGGKVQGHNDGGPIGLNIGGQAPQPHPAGQLRGPLNPNGYNEGGSVTETPIKKQMDLQKMDQNQMAFEMGEKRKDEAHQQAMMMKEKQAAEASKMKKEAATMKTPLSGAK